MKKVKLKDIAIVISGQSPKSIYYNTIGDGYKFLQGSRTFGYIHPTYNIWTTKVTKLAPKNSVLISVRAPVGDLNIADYDVCIGRGVYSLVAKNKNNKFIYYALKNIFPSYSKNISGTTFSSINKDQLLNIEIIAPTQYEIQQKISSVLCALDKRIEINNKINEQLEVMAKFLYDYWFVQFDFPDENGKPYFSSGGKMKFSPELKKEIPDGWEVKNLKYCLNKNRKKVNIKEYNKKKFIYNIDLKVMPNNSFILNNTNNKLSKTNLFKLEKYDILFGSIRPYLKKAGFAVDDGIVAGTVHQFRAKDNMFNFALCTLTTDNFFTYAVNNSHGTKMPVINEDAILEYAIPFNEKIIKLFEKINFKEIISSNIQQNQQLSSLRDWLLPMLMNGQVTFIK